MIPKTFSASALHVAELCMSRYKAQYIDHIPVIENVSAATLGSCCHTALENFVLVCLMDKTQESSYLNLLTFFKMAWIEYFGATPEESEPNYQFYQDGVFMMENWYDKMYPRAARAEILSTEEKLTFDLPTDAGVIPFTYIIDRLDKIVTDNDSNEYDIIDYKSQRWAVQPMDLKKKIQARVYPLAIAIQLKAQGKSWNKIWVHFDLLRHECVGVSFSRADIEETWKYIQEMANKIVNTPEDEAQETLNSECIYCPVKASCGKLTENIAGGGTLSLSIEDMVAKRAAITWQAAAIKALTAELDELITAYAMENDILSLEAPGVNLKFAVSKQRQVEGELVEKVVGTDIFELYGAKKMTIGQFDKLMKNPKLTQQQRDQLGGLVTRKTGDPYIKVESTTLESGV